MPFPERCHDQIWILVDLKFHCDIRCFCFVDGSNSIGRGFGVFECIRNGECDVLTVVTNDVVFEWRTSFFASSAFLTLDRTVNLSDVLSMKDCANSGHRLGRRSLEFGYPPVSDGSSYRNSIDQSVEMKVGRVLC